MKSANHEASHCTFLQSPITSSILGSNVASSYTIPFNTKTKFHTHTQTIGKIMVLCNIVHVSVGIGQEDKGLWTKCRQVYL